MNKNTKRARAAGWASMDDMNRGESGGGKRVVKGGCVNSERVGRKKWVGAAKASKRDGIGGDN